MQDTEGGGWKDEDDVTMVLFGSSGPGKAVSCFKVGILGCNKITSKFHGKDDAGLPMYSYTAHFKGHKSVDIKDPSWVTGE